MKTRMTSHRVYGVWEYDRELDDLNRLSAEGWQLEKGGCFHSTFVRNEEARYVYQLDYAPNLEDKEMYLSFFREQGWEYLNSTYNGWHYFRKPYQENMNAEEQEIYTDKESLIEMQGRYKRVILLLAVVYTMLAVCNFWETLSILTIKMGMLTLFCLFAAIVMWLIVCNISRKQNGQKEIVPIRISVFLFAIVGIAVITIFL